VTKAAVRSALVSTGRFARASVPQLHDAPSAPTARDLSTSSLSMAATVILVWVLHDFARLEMPPEIAAALSTVIGFFAARLFRY